MSTLVRKMSTVILLVTPAFASFHYVGRTLEPTAKLAYFPLKKSVYPVRHSVKTSRGVAQGVAATVKAVF